MRKLIIILLAVTFALGACSTTRQKLTPQGNVDFKTAQVYYSQKNVDKAEEFYSKVLADNPDHALSLRRMADINLHKGENIPAQSLSYNQAAFEQYEAAIKIYEAYENPTDEERMDIRDMKRRRDSAWVRIFAAGEKAYTEGNTQEAKEIFELASSLDEGRPQPMIRLKDIYLNDLQDTSKAEAILLQLVETDPKNLPYLLETGAFYYNQKDFTNAAKYFELAKTVAPSDIDNLMNLSAAYFELKDYQKALDTTVLAMNLQPNNLEVLSNAKDIARIKGDKQLAIQYLERLIALRSTEEDFSQISMMLGEMEDYQKLITYAKKWHDWDETSEFAVQYIILAANKTGDMAMQKAYQAILKAMP